MRISDWSSDVCSSDLVELGEGGNDGEKDRDDRGECSDLDRHPGAGQEPRQEVAEPGIAGHDDAQGAAEQRDHESTAGEHRSEELTSELQSLMRNSSAVFCLKKKSIATDVTNTPQSYNHSHHHLTTQLK